MPQRLTYEDVDSLVSAWLRIHPQVDKHFFAKVAGTAHLNRDGRSRQDILKECGHLEMLTLAHEVDNPVDGKAIAVLRKSGEQIGYLDARLAHETFTRWKDGEEWHALLTTTTGGNREHRTRGANILMFRIAGKSEAAMKTEESNTAKPSGDITRGHLIATCLCILAIFGLLGYVANAIIEMGPTSTASAAAVASAPAVDECRDAALAFMGSQQKGLDSWPLWKIGAKPKTLFNVREFEELSHGPFIDKRAKTPETYYSFRVESSTRGGFPIKARWDVITQRGQTVRGQGCGIVDLVQDN